VGTGESSWASCTDTLNKLRPTAYDGNNIVILDSRVCWHSHVETVDFYGEDTKAPRVVGVHVRVNGVYIQHGDRVLFARLGRVLQAVGGEWGGIQFWREVEDICYKEGCTIHARKGIRGGDRSYVFSEERWMERKR
jgi:hypothetical protein